MAGILGWWVFKHTRYLRGLVRRGASGRNVEAWPLLFSLQCFAGGFNWDAFVLESSKYNVGIVLQGIKIHFFEVPSGSRIILSRIAGGLKQCLRSQEGGGGDIGVRDGCACHWFPLSFVSSVLSSDLLSDAPLFSLLTQSTISSFSSPSRAPVLLMRSRCFDNTRRLHVNKMPSWCLGRACRRRTVVKRKMLGFMAGCI